MTLDQMLVSMLLSMPVILTAHYLIDWWKDKKHPYHHGGG